jgi:hypothetical protein
MGMNTHVVGFKAPNDKWKRMKKAYEACVEAGIEIPESIDDFFGGEMPDEGGIEVEIEYHSSVQRFSDPHPRDGFIVDIKGLLEHYPDLTHIRFFNSY